MALEAHEMRELLLFLLLHLSFVSFLLPYLAFDLALVEANATHVTKISLGLQHMLKGDFRVVAPL
jgi:hypothetical protein